MSVQTKVAGYSEPNQMSMYREWAEPEDCVEEIPVADSSGLVKGIRNGLAIMIPFYTILAGLLLLLKHH